MNKKFLAISKDKQDKIINAAFEVFSKNDYRHSTMENTASKAGISKSLLFHYFGSKKNMYLYVYDYGMEMLRSEMLLKYDWTETDLFKMLIQAQDLKCEIMKKYINLFEFIIKAYYEEDEEVAESLSHKNLGIIDRSIEAIIKRADMHKFKEGIEPEKILHMIIWCSDGFMRSKMTVYSDMDRINNEFKEILDIIKNNFYREEYLDGNN